MLPVGTIPVFMVLQSVSNAITLGAANLAKLWILLQTLLVIFVQHGIVNTTVAVKMSAMTSSAFGKSD